MKKLLNIAMVLAIGVLGMSCTKENNPNEEESGVYTFTAKAVDIAGADATKTYLGTDGLQALWTGNEVLHLAYVQNGEAKTVDAVLDPACKDKTDAIFTLKAEDATALANIETVYPYIVSKRQRILGWTQVVMEGGKIYLGMDYNPKASSLPEWDAENQTPTSTGYDPDWDVLVGKPIQVTDLKNDQPVVLQLTRPVALLKLVPNFEQKAFELVKDAKITYANVGIWGGNGMPSGYCGYDWEHNNLKQDGDFGINFSVGTMKTLDLDLNKPTPIYLFCFPVANADLDAYSNIRFSLRFSNGYVFNSLKKGDESSKIKITKKQPDFHLDAGKIHTITFTVKAERMTKN